MRGQRVEEHVNERSYYELCNLKREDFHMIQSVFTGIKKGDMSWYMETKQGRTVGAILTWWRRERNRNTSWK